MKLTLLLVSLLALFVHGGNLPENTALLSDTSSPDGRIAIVEPVGGNGKSNLLVELASGRTLAEIEGTPGLSRMNHGGYRADWSPDGRSLLWTVDGKWGPLGIVFLEIRNDGTVKQLDVLKTAHREFLARTRKAFPKSYAAAVAENKGNGSAYPDGFTVDALTPANAKPPLLFRFALTSNPKGIETFPERAQLDAYIEGTLQPGGKFTWSGFQAWDHAAAHRENQRANFVCEEIDQVTFRAGEKLRGAAKQKFEAEAEAWTKKHEEQFGEDTELAALSTMELNRRIRLDMEARIRALKKRK